MRDTGLAMIELAGEGARSPNMGTGMRRVHGHGVVAGPKSRETSGRFVALLWWLHETYGFSVCGTRRRDRVGGGADAGGQRRSYGRGRARHLHRDLGPQPLGEH